MKTKLKKTIVTIFFLIPVVIVSQTLNLGVLTSFECFTASGGVANSGGTVTGDAGTDYGVISGTYTGGQYNADAITAQCKFDLMRTYIHLNDLFVTYPGTHAAAFGSGETITPGIYSIAAAGSIGGALTLDGQDNANAIFVIKFLGAFTGGASATVTLINGAQSCNVFWLADGAISIAANANIKGTLFAKTGAVGLGAGVQLEGRMLSMAGAITVGVGASATPPPGTSNIPVFCESECDPATAVDVLGSVSDFVLFSSFGAVSNTSGTNGDIGTNAGTIYSSGIHIGSEYTENTPTLQAKIDLDNAYISLMALTATGGIHAAAFGSGETLSAGVYDMAAGSLGGTITLDAAGDPDAIFVMRFAGAFNVGAQAKIILANGAKRCNVFWLGGAGVATGAVNIGAGSTVKGNFISHGGACNSGAGVFLSGRQLSTGGAINTDSGLLYTNPECVTSIPLPIELLSFTATAKGEHTQLNWTTVTEINNDYFNIERSIDAVNWEAIAQIDGAGNSTSLLNYKTVDYNPYLGLSYYRLKQTDFDGKYSFSNIISVNLDENPETLIRIFPNPFTDQITIIGNAFGLSEFLIYNIIGQDVTNLTALKNNTGQTMVVDLSNLETGIYFVKVNSKTIKVYKK